jgi:hypothetical protein
MGKRAAIYLRVSEGPIGANKKPRSRAFADAVRIAVNAEDPIKGVRKNLAMVARHHRED